MKIFDCEQGSSDWFALRKGVPTASRFSRILTAKTMRLSAQADDLIDELVGETFSLIPPEGVENFTNRAVRWGQQCEEEARAWFQMETGADVQQVGFCLSDDGRFGASPDGLLPEKRQGLELKAPQASTQVSYLLAGGLPDAYRAQVHGSLIVTGYDSWFFLSYCPGLPALLVEVKPDDYTASLRAALDAFWERYQERLKKILAMR